MSAASFLHSSFLRAINAVMLWLVRVEKNHQASEHLCPAKLQTRCYKGEGEKREGGGREGEREGVEGEKREGGVGGETDI